jgi:hypothetical protein
MGMYLRTYKPALTIRILIFISPDCPGLYFIFFLIRIFYESKYNVPGYKLRIVTLYNLNILRIAVGYSSKIMYCRARNVPGWLASRPAKKAPPT